jgi:hypothetical protein
MAKKKVKKVPYEKIPMDGYTLYRFADGTEYRAFRFVRDKSIPENKDAATYTGRIAPQLVDFDEALRRKGLTRAEWWRQHEEIALENAFHCKFHTEIVG